jgi:hypothetical protein
MGHHVQHLRLDEGLLVMVGGGERGEAAPEAERAGHRAHDHDRGAAGCAAGGQQLTLT